MMGKSKLLKELNVAEQRGDLRAVATLCNALGRQHQEAGDLQAALYHHTNELDACAALGDTLGTALSHRMVGEVLFELGMTSKALEHQQQHLQLATEADNVLEQQRAYATIGRTYLAQAERALKPFERDRSISDASDSFLHSLQKCKELPPGCVTTDELALMRCRLYLNLGLVADYKGDANKAVGLISQASALGKQHSFQEDLYRCSYALGSVYLKQLKLGLALEEAKHTLMLSMKLKNYEKIDAQKTLGRIYLLTGDIQNAKNSYLAAYKLSKSEKGDYEELKSFVKACSKLCDIDKIDTQDLIEEEHMKHLEKMADLYAQLKLHDKAIENYKKVLEDAVIIGKTEEELAPIYYSVAETYFENKKYEEAIKYYKIEYNIRLKHEPKEACKTLLAIAVAAEQMAQPLADLEQYYNTALQLALQATCPKLQVHVLRLHAAFEDLAPDVKLALEEKARKIVQENDLDSDCELTDTNESVMESETDLSDAEEEQDGGKLQCSRTNNVIIRDIHKVNYFGETALHKACINGDLDKAKYLIKHGHAVNIRDKAGWLPLHEACNHGHLEIVGFLLSVGAKINDRGGQDCNGITPIHDAATCGHLEIVKLLIKKGASVIMKNNEGETPLDCLLAFKETAGILSDDDVNAIDSVANMLKCAMAKAGYEVKPIPHQAQGSSRDRHDKDNLLCSLRESQLLSTAAASDQDDVSDSDVSNSDGEPAVTASALPTNRHAVQSYKSAITCLGSALSRNCSDEAATSGGKTRVKKAKAGLIKEDEFVGENDFIENDVIVQSRKRKRPQMKTVLEFTKSSKERRLSGDTSIRQSSRKVPAKTKQIKLTSILDRKPKSSFINDYDDIFNDNSNNLDLNLRSSSPEIVGERELPYADNHTLSNHSTNGVLAADNTPSNDTPGNNDVATAVSSGTLRLRVTVEGETLLVPIAEANRSSTIEWLSDEVSLRYYQRAGIRPTISLATEDGALLHPCDPITLVLADQREEQLRATVTGWELPPLQQRYQQDCLTNRASPCPLVIAALTTAESSAVLRLERVTRSTAQVKLVLRALQRNQILHTVSLAYTKFTDDCFTLLLEVLPSLTGLSTISLQATGITKKAVTDWTEKIDSQVFSKSSLNNIDLSYNTLLGCTLSNIASLLSFPTMTSLNMSHCCLDIQHTCPMSCINSLQTLKLDYNIIHWSSLKLLLSNVPALKHLSLRGLNCSCDDSTGGIATALSNLLGAGKECSLEHLDLTSVALTGLELDTVRSYLYRCPALHHLAVAHNTALTSAAVAALLTELGANFNLPLSCLQLHGIPLDDDEFTQALVHLLQLRRSMQKPLQSLSYRFFPYSSLIIDTWKSIFNVKSKVLNVGTDVFLNVIH